jgi:hypothetical protein
MGALETSLSNAAVVFKYYFGLGFLFVWTIHIQQGAPVRDRPYISGVLAFSSFFSERGAC